MPYDKERLAELGRDAEEEALLRQMARLEKLLDRNFSIGGFRFGWGPIMGLVPVVGDTAATLLASWIVWQAHRIGVPWHVKARMVGHLGIDYLIGLTPIVGDFADALYKANTKNMRLMKAHLEKKRGGITIDPDD